MQNTNETQNALKDADTIQGKRNWLCHVASSYINHKGKHEILFQMVLAGERNAKADITWEDGEYTQVRYAPSVEKEAEEFMNYTIAITSPIYKRDTPFNWRFELKKGSVLSVAKKKGE